MAADYPNLTECALSLPEGDRANLAYQLLGSLKPPSLLSEGDPALQDELLRRLTSYDSGESQASDLDDITDRMRLAIKSRKSS